MSPSSRDAQRTGGARSPSRAGKRGRGFVIPGAGTTGGVCLGVRVPGQGTHFQVMLRFPDVRQETVDPNPRTQGSQTCGCHVWGAGAGVVVPALTFGAFVILL